MADIAFYVCEIIKGIADQMGDAGTMLYGFEPVPIDDHPEWKPNCVFACRPNQLSRMIDAANRPRNPAYSDWISTTPSWAIRYRRVRECRESWYFEFDGEELHFVSTETV